MSYGAALSALTTPPTAGEDHRRHDRSRQHARADRRPPARGGGRRQLRSPRPGIRGCSTRPHTARRAARRRSRASCSPTPTSCGCRSSISALVADQLTTFKKRFATVLGYARSKHLTPYDVLIVASIIEKEAATAHDQPLVASVIYNRLHDHIPLGMDSTTRYEFNDYTKPLTQSQLSRGLRTTRVCMPGSRRPRSATPASRRSGPRANPARTNYLYFVVKPCGNGASVFESNYSKFLQDSARYQSARARRGGRSPANC